MAINPNQIESQYKIFETGLKAGIASGNYELIVLNYYEVFKTKVM